MNKRDRNIRIECSRPPHQPHLAQYCFMCCNITQFVRFQLLCVDLMWHIDTFMLGSGTLIAHSKKSRLYNYIIICGALELP